jgi:hypothetical protein
MASGTDDRKPSHEHEYGGKDLVTNMQQTDNDVAGTTADETSSVPTAPTRLRRRGIVVGLAALTTGILAKVSEKVAQATSGTSPEGNFVLGANAHTAGRTANTATTTTQLNASGGGANGALEVNNTGGRGIVATSAAGFDGLNSTSATASGVRGTADAAGPNTNIGGVRGEGNGVAGVRGRSTSYCGVLGLANVAAPTDPSSSQPMVAGVVGAGNTRPGIAARSEAQSAIYAVCMAPAGPGAFECVAPNTYAVVATSTNYSAVVGTTHGDGYGVAGIAAGATSRAAVFGRVDAPAGPGTWAGQFVGNVLVEGNLTVLGTVSSAAPNPQADGGYRRTYAVESAQGWVEDFGEARLVDGRATVPLPAELVQMADTARYYVFLTPHDAEVEALAVTARHRDRFEVVEHGKGASTAAFAYRIVARRNAQAQPQVDRVVVPPRATLPVRKPMPVQPATEAPAAPRPIQGGPDDTQ